MREALQIGGKKVPFQQVRKKQQNGVWRCMLCLLCYHEISLHWVQSSCMQSLLYCRAWRNNCEMDCWEASRVLPWVWPEHPFQRRRKPRIWETAYAYAAFERVIFCKVRENLNSFFVSCLIVGMSEWKNYFNKILHKSEIPFNFFLHVRFWRIFLRLD